MISATATSPLAPSLSRTEINRAVNARFSWFCLFLGTLMSGFVISEPAPYDLYMVAVFCVWMVLGLRISQTVMVLLAFLIVFNIGGIISMTQMKDWTGAPMYVAVSFFLAGTAVFVAAVLEGDHRRTTPLMYGWIGAAVITGLLGIAGYFGFGGESFIRFGRAKGAFQDPNVFGPFLITPALFCLGTVLTRPLSRSLVMLPALLILTLAVFFSFSRAAWGLYAVSITIFVGLLLLCYPSNRFRLRILFLSIAAIVALVAALMVAIQIDSVAEMFGNRAKLVQDYDGERLGRFARHGIGLRMSFEHPLGMGIMQFAKHFGEDQHNVYLKTLWDYSWLGFATYVTMVIMTLAAGFKIILRDRPWRLFLMSAWVVFLGHVLIGYVIDTDHWRHFFLLLGIIWGCVALERKWQHGAIARAN